MHVNAVTLQLGTSRRGIPHARRMREYVLTTLQGVPRSVLPVEIGLLKICIRVVGAAESRVLNRNWRGKDKPTNVLSFPSGEVVLPAFKAQALILGDLAICAPVIAREAYEQNKAARDHWAHMVVHGVLHLLGYDHERDRDAQVMERLEKAILKRLRIADPYR